jgi:alpha-D-ribose 1-methylphosphonate 5-phosphate C-P lyase
MLFSTPEFTSNFRFSSPQEKGAIAASLLNNKAIPGDSLPFVG